MLRILKTRCVGSGLHRSLCAAAHSAIDKLRRRRGCLLQLGHTALSAGLSRTHCESGLRALRQQLAASVGYCCAGADRRAPRRRRRMRRGRRSGRRRHGGGRGLGGGRRRRGDVRPRHGVGEGLGQRRRLADDGAVGAHHSATLQRFEEHTGSELRLSNKGRVACARENSI